MISLDTATLIWAIILGVGALVWLLGLRAHRRAFGAEALRPTEGSVEIPVPPELTSRALAHLLAGGGQFLLSRVERADAGQVVALVGLPMNPGRKGILREDARARLTCHLSSGLVGTAIRYSLDSRLLVDGLARWSRALLILGAVALIAVAVVMPQFVIPSENPAIRGQVFQSIQAGHFLWPPFLIAYLSRRLRGALDTRIADILSNLPHLLAQAQAAALEN